MRLYFDSLDVFKRAAKQLTSSHKLAERQNLLAKACGYRDFHDVTTNLVTSSEVSSQRAKLTVDEWADLVIRITGETGKDYGDSQYELSTARFLPTALIAVKGAVNLREKIFERTTLSPVVGRVRGAVVHLKKTGRDRGERALFLREGKDNSSALVLKDNCRIPLPVPHSQYLLSRAPLGSFIPTRLYEPYGYVTEDDGTKIVFSRDYLALWKVVSGTAAQRVSPFAVSTSSTTKWFPAPGRSLSKNEAAEPDALQKFRLVGLPRLVEVLPQLIAQDGDFRSVLKEFRRTGKVGLASNSLTSTKNPAVVFSDTVTFPTKSSARKVFKAILVAARKEAATLGRSFPIVITDPEAIALLTAMAEYFDREKLSSDSKIGKGILRFEVRIPDDSLYRTPNAACFHIVRVDNTSTDISYLTAIDGHATSFRTDFLKTVRELARLKGVDFRVASDAYADINQYMKKKGWNERQPEPGAVITVSTSNSTVTKITSLEILEEVLQILERNQTNGQQSLKF